MSDELIKTNRYATRNRIVRQDNLRESLRAKAYVRILEQIAGDAHRLDATEVPANRLKADIYLKLLAKVLPDLKQVEHSGHINGSKLEELTDARLAHIASAGRNRAIEAPGSQEEPGELH